MDALLTALQRAGRDLLTPRMLTLSLWPMLLALLAWGLLAWLFGAELKDWLTAWLATTPFDDLAARVGAGWLAGYAALLILALVWLPAMYVTALMITSLALMPVIVAFVAARDYPALERRRGGGFVGSVANGLVALVLYLAAWLVLLPVWLFAPFGILVSVLLNAWLNQRLFMYDALAEHASAAELKAQRHAGGGRLFALSTLLGLIHLVPVLNLVAPVYMALAFSHHALAALAASRAEAAA
ncbi:MAG: EI24 domain-containing protein [Gallionellaceae bacterium]|nr:EI24 domain-containing protein [Gallionellaceae bacterium]